ncbi:MAG: hypothetical protein ACRC33_17590 [Gemmataceae bacterium]
MSAIDRRQLLQNLLGGLLGTAGTAVLARATLAPAEAQAAAAPGSIEERADKVAAAVQQAPEGEQPDELTAFLNGGFLNGGGPRGILNNGRGFLNGGGGRAFLNGGGGRGFLNGGNGFNNGGFFNGGGFPNGFNNGGFFNGGFPNGAFRNF